MPPQHLCYGAAALFFWPAGFGFTAAIVFRHPRTSRFLATTVSFIWAISVSVIVICFSNGHSSGLDLGEAFLRHDVLFAHAGCRRSVRFAGRQKRSSRFFAPAPK